MCGLASSGQWPVTILLRYCTRNFLYLSIGAMPHTLTDPILRGAGRRPVRPVGARGPVPLIYLSLSLGLGTVSSSVVFLLRVLAKSTLYLTWLGEFRKFMPVALAVPSTQSPQPKMIRSCTCCASPTPVAACLISWMFL